MIAVDPIARRIEAAQPERDHLDRQLVRSQAMAKLFAKEVALPTVGRFRLEERLGAGGQGVVYAAYDPDLARSVAVKLVRVYAESERKTTLAEAQALAKLSHPNVVAIYDVGVVDEHVYMVMELVDGANLRQYAHAKGRTYRAVLAAYRQAAEGLAAAHRAGLVHRDFKPDNAVIDDEGRVRVIDFGLAIERDSQAARGGGTPGYRAPEQVQGGSVGPAADQYALALSIREAVAASPDGAEAKWVTAIVERGTQAAPEQRFGTLDELIAAMGRDPRLLWRRRGIGLLAAVSVATAFVGGATLFGAKQQSPSCDGGPKRLESAWSKSAQELSLARMHETSPYGELVAARVRAGAEAFSSSWTEVHQGVCLEHANGESSELLLDKRMQCLAAQRQAFARLGSLASNSTETTLSGVVLAQNALPIPSDCHALSSDALDDTVAPQHANDVASIDERLAEAHVLIAAGDFDEASRLTASLETEARATGHASTLARVLLFQGRLAIAKNDRESAGAPLAEATTLALTASKNAIAVEAWARRAWVDGMAKDPAAALAGMELVEALAQQVGTESFANGLLRTNVGSIRIAQGEHALAREELTEAVRIARSIRGPNELELVNARGNLAIVTTDAAKRDALAAESVTLLTELVGAEHPQTLEAALNRGRLSLSPDQALAQIAPTCKALQTFHPALRLSVAQCHIELGWLAAQLRDTPGALTALRTAVEFGDERSPARGLTQLWSGDSSAAVQTLRALQATVSSDSPWWVRFRAAESRLALGYALATSGKAEGTTLMRQALVELESIASPVPTVERRIALARMWLGEGS